ncbi:tetratricopeptide repeat protein [Arthrobacter sp. SAFR-044]|uniref:tetratricopeptide repeat protein n=1 Tax=Arthrobacter sp. SAFR-044 TaxID=3387278 RepID=UPI003F7C8033
MNGERNVWEPPFVGEEQRIIVDDLVSAFNQVSTAQRPQWIHLTAPSGWGKTRIAREFYARLAADKQSTPNYWPDTILGSLAADNIDLTDVSSRRKRLYPTVTHVPKSLPSWMWWGVDCSNRSGGASNMLAEELRQFEAHAEYLDMAVKRKGGGNIWVDFAKAVGEEGFNEGLGHAAEELANAAVPGVGLVTWGVKRAIASNKQRMRRKHLLEGSVDILGQGTGTAQDLLGETYLLITGLASRGLPVVILAEDVQQSTAIFAQLLEKLISSEVPVLLLTTAWPGNPADNTELDRALNARPDRLIVVTHQEHDGRVTSRKTGLGKLSIPDRKKILGFYYPDIERDTGTALAMRYPNPLALELFCQIEKYQKRFSNKQLCLDKAEVLALPAKVRDLYRVAWHALPKSVRLFLSVAAQSTPAAISPQEHNSKQWNQNWLFESLISLGFMAEDEVALVAKDAQTSYSWIRHMSVVLYQFHEADQMLVALEDDSFVFAHELNKLLEFLAHKVAHEFEMHPSGDEPAKEHAARLTLALYARGLLRDGQLLVEAADYLVTGLRGSAGDFVEIIRIAEYVLPQVDQWSISALSLELIYGDALHEAGRFAEALIVYERSLPQLETLAGQYSQIVFQYRRKIASAIAMAGDYHRGSSLYEVLLADQIQHLGGFHSDTLATRRDIAIVNSTASFDEAAFRSLIADEERIYGPGHKNTWPTLEAFGQALWKVNRNDEAAVLYRELLSAHEQESMGDDPDNLATKNDYGLTFLGEERVEEAVAWFETLHDDVTRVMGPTHPATLNVENNWAVSLLRASKRKEAIQLFEKVLSKRSSVLGFEHPDTLESKHALADALALDGSPKAAMKLFEEVIADRRRILGQNHPRTLNTCHNIAGLLSTEGRHAEAIDAFVKLIKNRQLVLGVDHPDTLRAKHDLGNAMLRAQQPDAALKLFQAVLSRQVRTLGEDHRLTLRTRFSLANALQMTLRLAEATRLRRSVLADQIRVLGHDHPDTETTRAALNLLEP